MEVSVGSADVLQTLSNPVVVLTWDHDRVTFADLKRLTVARSKRKLFLFTQTILAEVIPRVGASPYGRVAGRLWNCDEDDKTCVCIVRNGFSVQPFI